MQLSLSTQKPSHIRVSGTTSVRRCRRAQSPRANPCVSVSNRAVELMDQGWTQAHNHPYGPDPLPFLLPFLFPLCNSFPDIPPWALEPTLVQVSETPGNFHPWCSLARNWGSGYVGTCGNLGHLQHPAGFEAFGCDFMSEVPCLSPLLSPPPLWLLGSTSFMGPYFWDDS